MNATTRRGGFAALISALGSALQWRMLLWWLLALWLPTLLVAIPLWSSLQSQFGASVHAAAIAGGKALPLFADGFTAMADAMSALTISMILATLLTLLLSPWLSGMVVASIRARRRLRLGELLHGGLGEYWRMFRTLLWSLVVLAAAAALGIALQGAIGQSNEPAILVSEMETTRRIGLGVLVAVLLFAHMTLEAGRGCIGADAGLRSALRGWWRGLKLVLRRPLAALIVYLGAALAGYGLAALLGLWRLNVDTVDYGGFALGLLLTQLAIATLAWGRIARLYGFAGLVEPVDRQPATATADTTVRTDTDTDLPQHHPETARP